MHCLFQLDECQSELQDSKLRHFRATQKTKAENRDIASKEKQVQVLREELESLQRK